MGASILIALTLGTFVGPGCELALSASVELRFSAPLAHRLMLNGMAAVAEDDEERGIDGGICTFYSNFASGPISARAADNTKHMRPFSDRAAATKQQ